jgi:hypothetical protein
LLLTEFTKIVRNEILHVQFTTHNAVIPYIKLTGRFKSEHFRLHEGMLGRLWGDSVSGDLFLIAWQYQMIRSSFCGILVIYCSLSFTYFYEQIIFGFRECSGQNVECLIFQWRIALNSSLETLRTRTCQSCSSHRARGHVSHKTPDKYIVLRAQNFNIMTTRRNNNHFRTQTTRTSFCKPEDRLLLC